MIRRPPRSTLFPLHDALPILLRNPKTIRASTWPTNRSRDREFQNTMGNSQTRLTPSCSAGSVRSEEHTSELQSRRDLVCRLLLEKKKKKNKKLSMLQKRP